MFRISRLDWPRILFTRRTAILLGLAAAFSVCGLAIIHSEIDIGSLCPLKRDAVSVIGAAGAFGLVTLIVCMGFFWLICDSSSKPNRTVWFVLLLLGFAYGSSIAYYAFVYLPAVIKRLRDPESEDQVAPPPRLEEVKKRIGPFRRILLLGWGFLLPPVAFAIAIPKIMSPFLGPITVLFFFWSAIVLLEAFTYAVISLYRSGMNRPPSSGPTGPSGPQTRDK
jgi:hypothetical protein